MVEQIPKYAETAAKHEEEARQREQEAKEKFDNGEISEAEYKTLLTASTKHKDAPAVAVPVGQLPGSVGFDESQFMTEDELGDPGAELTQDDKIFLAMKWGRLYKPSE